MIFKWDDHVGADIQFNIRREQELWDQAAILHGVSDDRPHNISGKQEYPDEFRSRNNTKRPINNDRERPEPKPRKPRTLFPDKKKHLSSEFLQHKS